MNQKNKSALLLNGPDYQARNGLPKLLRITFCTDHTKVDFGYQTGMYIRGGWVDIARDTFIRIQDTEERFTMTRAENIPLAPVKKHFNTRKDWLYFSLWFPEIPVRTCKMDLLEADPGDFNNFNYLNININTRDLIGLL